MKKAFYLIISFSLLFTLSVFAADKEPVNFSSTGTNPCSVTINQDLTYIIPNANYDGGPLVGQITLELDFTFFGEQNGQLLWQLGDVNTSPSSTTCSVSIASDLSFTLTDAVYDAGPQLGKMALQAKFQYFGEQNGVLLWYLADIKVDDEPTDPTPTTPVVLGKTQITLESGNSETITISGGTGYYTVITNNSQVASTVISRSNLEITGLSSGAATITVSDTGGETASISVTVSSSTTPSGNCGAYVAPGVWKEFDCYNLAAIGKTTNDDPFTPSWRLIGGYWQWGRKGPDPSDWYDTNTEHFAHGPTGPDYSEANNGFINWDNDNALKGAWSDSVKTSNDPCPAGYRVPTQSQWGGVIDNNTRSSVGSWDRGDTNYSSALYFGDNLLLPAAGLRHPDLGGDLVNSRGFSGYYWSSTESTPRYSHSLSFYWDGIGTAPKYRGYGFSVRCIAE